MNETSSRTDIYNGLLMFLKNMKNSSGNAASGQTINEVKSITKIGGRYALGPLYLNRQPLQYVVCHCPLYSSSHGSPPNEVTIFHGFVSDLLSSYPITYLSYAEPVWRNGRSHDSGSRGSEPAWANLIFSSGEKINRHC